MMKLILASASERRRTLLRRMGYEFDVIVPEIENEAEYGITELNISPRFYAETLAERKALEVRTRTENAIIISADTVVAYRELILGKPRDENDARTILRTLSGTTHFVITGFCLYDTHRKVRLIGSEESRLSLKEMTDEEIRAYIKSGLAFGKAGAYAINELNDRYATVLSGSIENVMGLPVREIETALHFLKFPEQNGS